MNIKKKLLLALPLLGVAVGGLTALGSRNASVAEAADYSTSARDFELNTDNYSVSATFTVSNSDLDLKGWLLCLLSDKPDYNLDTRKLTDSDNLHPYGYTNCVSYFFASYTQEEVGEEGKISITWAANAADQKIESLWNVAVSTDETENLAKYMKDTNDYHIVIGPRHTRSGWETTDQIGNGKDNIWENCDYYVGRKKALLHGVDGQTYLDLSGFNDWANDGAMFKFKYSDNSNNEAWSEIAVSSGFAHIYIAQYSLDFVPTEMKAYRFNSEATVEWNHSEAEDFSKYGVLGIDGWDDNSWSYGMAGIKFGEDNIVSLDHLKRNTAGHSENFNQFVSLAKGDEFVVSFDSTTCTTYSTYDTLTSNFKLNENNKIEVLEGGNYALYFDTDSRSLYITTELMAKLDEWCQRFLGADCTATIENWSSSKYEYKDIADDYEGAEEYLLSVPHVAHNVEVEGYIAKAMQRYDFLVANFAGYSDYIGRSNSQNFTPYSSGAISLISKGGDATIIIIVSSITLAAFASLLIVRKKKRIK